jgi:hypothetical protein
MHHPSAVVVAAGLFALLTGGLFGSRSQAFAAEDSAVSTASERVELSAADERFFESKVRPLLVEHCYECHSREAGESSGELFLDSAAAIAKGGTMGQALVPGKPDESLLIQAVGYEDFDLQMPPAGKLDADSIEILREWVKRGAPDPRRSMEDADLTEPASPLEIDPSSHWAYNPPQRFRGSVSTGEGDVDVIDSIARRAAEEAGLVIAPRCDDETLVRRLYYDLTGLPPGYDQIRRFVQSDSPDKVERLVDQLLASPAYGERFARHWMDVARYADTVGYALAGRERRLKGSERYRDWLIHAFADDLPFDDMIRYQLAGDRFDPENRDGNLDAMGFLTIGRRFLNRFDTIDDRIDVITRGLMGMTVACARCHDHKFDPIPTADYYSLLGVFQSSEEKPDGPSPLMMTDKEKPQDSRIFVRGQPGNRGEVAPRQYLTALRDPDEDRFSDGSGRLELAERLASSDNPLVPRVFVNRVWMWLVGQPLVESTSDFGVRTEPPELVELLDELSAEFSEHWSVKRLVRRIVTSRIYAQSSQPASEAALSIDPENRLAARANRKRRDFESMRDAMLSVCGYLDRRIGGPPVEIHLATPVSRRTLYAMIDRQNLPSLFKTFDFASPDAHTPKRLKTTVPQQALFLMNHPQLGVFARQLADLVRDSAERPSQQIELLYRRVFGRKPDAGELAACEAFLSSPARERPPEFDSRKAWRYGTAPVNEESRAADFEPFRHFTGSTWQDGEKLPAENELAYASLGVENGHPGRRHAVVRRWVAPTDGKVEISGMVGHRNDKGDGVELAIWIGDRRVWRENQKKNNRPFRGIRGEIRAGESVDFVVSPRESDSFDSFFLRCQVSLKSGDGKLYGGDSERDFSGPISDAETQPLTRLEQLAQMLLVSNEFFFVD